MFEVISVTQSACMCMFIFSRVTAGGRSFKCAWTCVLMICRIYYFHFQCGRRYVCTCALVDICLVDTCINLSMPRTISKPQNHHLFLRRFLRQRLYSLHRRLVKRRIYLTRRDAASHKTEVRRLHRNIDKCRLIVARNRAMSRDSGCYILTALAAEALDMALMSAVFVVDYKARNIHKFAQ